MKKYFVGFFALGFVVGFIAMGLLAMHASKFYLQLARYGYLGQQEMLAVEARKNGNLDVALIHYTNVVDSASSPILQYLETQPHWNFLFPLLAPIVERMANAPDVERGKTKVEGVSRLELAVVLEELGRKEEAQDQYRKAATTLGVSPERATELAGAFRRKKD